jgi:uncharacterized protein YxeA
MKCKIIVIIGSLILVAILAITIFAYRNFNYDFGNKNFLKKKGYKLGFTLNWR